MRIPKQLNILGKRWKVSYKWNLTLDDRRCDGLCDFDLRTIFIDRSSDKEDRPRIFIHEILHAVIYESNLNHADSFSDEIEEILVETISRFMVDKFTLRLKREG